MKKIFSGRFSLRLLALFSAVLIVGSPNFTSALTIENIASNKGPVAGGNEVTITGSGFTTTLQLQDEIIDIVGATEINPHSDIQYGTVLVLTKGGKLYSYGSNVHGSVGVGTSGNCAVPSSLDSEGSATTIEPCYYTKAQDISGFFDSPVIAIRQLLNNDYDVINFAVTKSGKAYVWGYNTSAFNNELRNGRFYSYSQPTLIKDLEPEHVIGINALGFHTDTNLIMSYTDKNGGNFDWVSLDISSKIHNEGIETIAAPNLQSGHSNILNDLIITTKEGSAYWMYSTMPEQINLNERLIQKSIDDGFESLNITNLFDSPVKQIYVTDDRIPIFLTENGGLYVLDESEGKPAAIAIDGIPGVTKFASGQFYYESDCIFFVQTIDGQILAVDLISDDDNIFQTSIILPDDSSAKIFNAYGIDNGNQIYSYLTIDEADVVYSKFTREPRMLNATDVIDTGDTIALTDPVATKIPLEVTEVVKPAIKNVLFSGIAVTSFEVIDDSTIKAIVPAGTAGFVDVTLEQIDETKEDIVIKQGYEYIAQGASDIEPGAPNAGIGKILRSPLAIIFYGFALLGSLYLLTKNRQAKHK